MTLPFAMLMKTVPPTDAVPQMRKLPFAENARLVTMSPKRNAYLRVSVFQFQTLTR